MNGKFVCLLCLSYCFTSPAGKVTARESTLGARPSSQKQFYTPAPGEYDIDRIDKSRLQSGGCVRGYTFGHPNSQFRSSRIPGKQWK